MCKQFSTGDNPRRKQHTKAKNPSESSRGNFVFFHFLFHPPFPFRHKQKQQSKIVSRGKGLNSTRFMHELILPALCVAAVKLLLHVTYATKCRVRVCVCVCGCMCVCVCRIPQQRLLTVYSLQHCELRCKVCNKFSHCLCAARVGRGAVAGERGGTVGWRVAHT